MMGQTGACIGRLQRGTQAVTRGRIASNSISKDKVSWNGAFYVAASHGHGEVIKLLLGQKDVELNSRIRIVVMGAQVKSMLM